MNLEQVYENRFGPFTITNLPYYIIAGQVLAYLLVLSNPNNASLFTVSHAGVISGEWWRLVLFLFAPFSMSPLWAALEWYFFYMIGTSLERIWGSFRFTLYLLIGYLATGIAVVVFPSVMPSNTFLFSSLFLAYAVVNPEASVLVFFIIPVKLKWIALVSWLGIVSVVLFGPVPVKIEVVASVCNFFAYFWRDVSALAQMYLRKSPEVLRASKPEPVIYMQCTVCHATQEDRKIFYYCHTCIPELCFCEDHIKKHKHRIVN